MQEDQDEDSVSEASASSCSFSASARRRRWVILRDEVQLQEEIGRGRYGVAFRGLYKGRVVAVKVSPFSFTWSWSWSSRCQTLCATEQTTMQPRRELSGRSGLSVDVNTQALSGIQDVLFLHVFVVTFSPDRYYGVVTHQQGLNFWLVTEFVTGHCLAKLLQQPDLKSLYKIRRKERLRMSACLASAMDYLHNRFHRILWQLLFHCPLYLHHPHTPKTFYARNNIYILYSVATHRKLVHGDLTPSNVMVCQHGDSKQVKITDFGLLEVDFLW